MPFSVLIEVLKLNNFDLKLNKIDLQINLSIIIKMTNIVNIHEIMTFLKNNLRLKLNDDFVTYLN